MSGQRVAITGASGLIGGALSSYLRARGDDVVRLVRRPARAVDEVTWAPTQHTIDTQALRDVTAVVHLAGAGVGDHRWTSSYKDEIRQSRVDGTTTIATALAELDAGTRLVSGSAMGYYGDRGDEHLDETSSGGDGFLADVVRDWEAATQPAIDAGCPTAFIRTGLVLSPKGGALGKMLPLAQLGLGGPLGNGRQWWSWITLEDHIRAVAHLIDHPEVTGPVNLVGPQPERQRDVARALGRQLHRPALLPAPSLALRLVLGEMSGDILGSQRLDPRVLRENGFTWNQPTIEEACGWVLAQRRSA